jgi:hypothetical protein
MISAITMLETAERFAERLSAWCVVEADGKRYNFRLSDTRRLPDIVGVLSNQQGTEIAGNAIGWRYNLPKKTSTQMLSDSMTRFPDKVCRVYFLRGAN